MPSDKKKDVIKEAELFDIMGLREALAAKRKDINKTEGDLSGKEKDVMDRLIAGATCKGKLVASIEMALGACRPPWKDDYLAHMTFEHGIAAKAAEETIRSKYPPAESQKLNIGYAKGPGKK